MVAGHGSYSKDDFANEFDSGAISRSKCLHICEHMVGWLDDQKVDQGNDQYDKQTVKLGG